MFVLKLLSFFTRLYGEGKRAAISKLTYLWNPSSRSYIIFAIVLTVDATNVARNVSLMAWEVAMTLK